MSTRPLIVGMNNPISLDPKYALYPTPRGCAGNRLYEMLREMIPSVTMMDYVRRFDRINLVSGPWSAGKARERALELLPTLVGRRVVLLGRGVQSAFRASSSMPVARVLTEDGITFYLLPHPSGRNLQYNDQSVRLLAGRILRQLYDGHEVSNGSYIGLRREA